MIEMRENLVEVADVIMEDLYVEVVSVSADGTVTITVKPDPDTF